MTRHADRGVVERAPEALLALAQVGLGLPARGDVAADLLHLDDVIAVVAHAGELPLEPSPPGRRETATLAARAKRRQHRRLHRGEDSLTIVGMEEEHGVPAENALARIADRRAEGIVGEREIAVAVEARHEIARRLDETAVPRLARAQRVLGRAPLGDVAPDGLRLDHPAGGVGDDAAFPGDPANALER